ncbi:2-hydroxyacid dehydrogenase [Microlunatus endophyticus]|uniref:2-hydroxyacid dehydrogenase n=1 Tax=Microlunatus endophyticus TaxID=1716077 RepID=A0A917S5M7_9ACTN|nr:hydroxyacid dehydrogenase [Microlunatus endophyticus]GGL57733.1 2-hydroxyacid dehydrogenase [Microlunatus endophyticus]
MGIAERPRVALAMGEAVAERQFGGGRLDRLRDNVEVLPGVITDFAGPGARQLLAEADILLTGWSCPRIDGSVLEAAPRLRAVVHAAGTVKAMLADEVWDSGLLVCSMAELNALPVAEFVLAMILLENKRVLPITAEHRRTRRFPAEAVYAGAGNYRKRIGLISASKVGRRVAELLQPFELDVVIADPYCGAVEVEALGATKIELEDLFATSDIVSLHAPLLPQTIGMINSDLLARIKDGATFISTARGKIVDHDALIGQARTGRFRVLLDVTDPEPLPADSALWDLENVVITPHLAGSKGVELDRMADGAISEINRIVAGEEPLFRVPPERRDLLA